MQKPIELKSVLMKREEEYRDKSSKEQKTLFNRSDLLEHAGGKISKIFGPSFKELDFLKESDDAKEGIKAFIEKRDPKWK